MWVRASKRGIGAVPTISKNLRVRRKGDEQILFNRDEIALGMNKVSTGQSQPTSYDECMFLMPDVLNPKDGKRIVVEISAVQRGGEQAEERDFVYEFSPMVERGWIRCLTS